MLFMENALSSYLLTPMRTKALWDRNFFELWLSVHCETEVFTPVIPEWREKRKKCKCNFSSLWVTKSYPHASNEIAFRWHSIMDTKSFLQLLWDWCWTHTGTDVFVWLWVNISIVCHAVTFLLFPLSILFFPFSFFLFSKCLLMFWSCFDFIFSSLWVLSDWFGTLSRFHLICVFARTQNAWLVPFSSAWPSGVCVIYGKWNPALKSTI